MKHITECIKAALTRFRCRVPSRNSEMGFVPEIRNAYVYYNDNGLVIGSTVWSLSRFETLGEPISKLSYHSHELEIGDAVLSAIEGSKVVNDDEFYRLTSHFRNVLGLENGQDESRCWECIRVSQQIGSPTVTIFPMRRYERGGYRSDASIACTLNANEIGPIIRHILDTPRLPPIPHEPSHT